MGMAAAVLLVAGCAGAPPATPARTAALPVFPPPPEAPEPPAPVREPAEPEAPVREPAKPSAQAPESTRFVATLTQEVKSIRSLIESQLVNLAWGEMKSADPLKFAVMRTLLGIGFSPRLARELSTALPKNLNQEQSLRWVRSALAHNLRCTHTRDDPIAHGGVYALVGPTGVGKTTTIAKLAARCVLKQGAASLALITTDTYRIGAHEQLKIYGKILNAPVYAVKDQTELSRTLSELRHKHLVLIDTAGMSQRDSRIREQLALLSSNTNVQRLLLLSATAQAGTLDDVVRAYQGNGFAGAILTKIDEALNLAPALDVSVRHKLAIHYVTNGQRVPEDLHLAHNQYLVDRAFKCAPDTAHQPREEEYPLMISAREEEARSFLGTTLS